MTTNSIIKLTENNIIEANEAYKLADGPLLQQILVQSDAIIPITTKIRVVTKNPISIS